MDTVKQVAITGSAVNHYISSGSRKTRRGRRGTAQMGGDGDPAEISNNNPAISSAKLNIVKTGGGNATAVTTSSVNADIPVAPPIIYAQTSAPTPVVQQQGGKPKIILAPKQKTKKVILAAKHQQKLHLPHKKHHKQTIRRVCLPVNVIKTKIAKTRKHIKESQSMSIDKIRKELIASKLLNPASKAPDSLLRKIYADVKIIGTN
jgi:hypothetical protein